MHTTFQDHGLQNLHNGAVRAQACVQCRRQACQDLVLRHHGPCVPKVREPVANHDARVRDGSAHLAGLREIGRHPAGDVPQYSQW